MCSLPQKYHRCLCFGLLPTNSFFGHYLGIPVNGVVGSPTKNYAENEVGQPCVRSYTLVHAPVRAHAHVQVRASTSSSYVEPPPPNQGGDFGGDLKPKTFCSPYIGMLIATVAIMVNQTKNSYLFWTHKRTYLSFSM